MPRLLAGLTAGLLAVGLTACGAAAPGVASAGWGEAGRSITLRSGQELNVDLSGTSCTPIGVPVSSTPAVLEVERVGRDRGNAWARFQARRPGTAYVTAATTASCGGTASDEPLSSYRLRVEVR